MKRLILITICLVGSLVGGCLARGGFHIGRLKGSGVVKTEQRTVSPFTGVDSNGSFNVTVECQKTQSLEIEGDDNLLQFIQTEVKDGTLRITCRKNFSTHKDIQVRITIPELKTASLSGSGNFTVSNLKNEEFDLDLNGSGNMKVAGTSKSAKFDLNGSGNINAANLTAEKAEVDVSGSGNVKVFASDTLEATISGSGDVVFSGDPKNLKKHINGSGSITKKSS